MLRASFHGAPVLFTTVLEKELKGQTVSTGKGVSLTNVFAKYTLAIWWLFMLIFLGKNIPTLTYQISRPFTIPTPLEWCWCSGTRKLCASFHHSLASINHFSLFHFMD